MSDFQCVEQFGQVFLATEFLGRKENAQINEFSTFVVFY